MFGKFFPENRTVYEISWKNMVRPNIATEDNIIRRMRLACWATKATIRAHNHYTVRSESRCALRVRYVDLVVGIEVAVEVCVCFAVFSC
jgi:hypothetical protein